MEIPIRATVIFFLMLLLVRSMGRRELSEMSAFELLVLVTMGDLVQQGVTQEDMSLTGAALAVGTMAIWSVVLSYITFRWRRTEPVLTGLPVVVVRNGAIIEESLNVERTPVDDVYEAARQQGINDLAKISIGIMEADGKFSFIRTDDERNEPPERHVS